jgi:hypothetical protein
MNKMESRRDPETTLKLVQGDEDDFGGEQDDFGRCRQNLGQFSLK